MKTTLLIWKMQVIACLALMLAMQFAVAQQIPISLYGLSNPRIFNPASAGGWKTNQLVALHQQRGDLGNGWGRVSDFFSFSSAQLQGKSHLGWGMQLMGDGEHTDTRFALSPTIAATILQRPSMRWGVGISGGFLYYGSNYDSIPIRQSPDPKLVNTGFVELDAGAGTDFTWRNRWMHGDAGIYFTQLPGNPISKGIPGAIHFLPHALIYGGVLLHPAYNLSIGPRLFYRNTMSAIGETILQSQLDIGLKAEFERQNLWVTAGYRINHGGITAGLGAKIWERDTLLHPEKVYLGLHLNAVFGIPGWKNNPLGSTAEIGLGMMVGQKYRTVRVDTVSDIGYIWESTANLTKHKDLRLAPGSPPGIVAGLTLLDSHVVVTYEFPDDSRLYVGDYPEWAADSLLSDIGQEWVGIDNFLENLMDETVEECLSPDLSHVAYKDKMDSLKRLMWVQLSTNLKWDQQSALTGPGIAYYGELNPPGHKFDTLRFKVVYDERDTIVTIPPRAYYLNNFELAALKLYAMRKKLEYEIKRYYAEQNRNVMVAWEDQLMPIHWDVNADEIELKATSLLFILKLRIESDHPKQKYLQNTMVTLKFRRYREGDSRERIFTPRPGQVYSTHMTDEEGGSTKKNRKTLREVRFLKREDFVKTQPAQKKRPKRNAPPPKTSPSGGSLNH